MFESLFEIKWRSFQSVSFCDTFAELKLQSADILSALQSTPVMLGKVKQGIHFLIWCILVQTHMKAFNQREQEHHTEK